MTKIYWGDLHNHCAASYGTGTPARALDNARQHLDFCTITGHAFWDDMPMDLKEYNSVIATHLGGFAKLKIYWKEILRELRQANVPGRFVTLPSYERHSMKYGDYNCYFPSFDVELLDAPDLDALTRLLRRQKHDFMMLPHHCGYARGYRGLNWRYFDERRSPLIEIYSNHGCGEADDAAYEYHHTMGPRVSESMLRHGLLQGHRFGFYASTDTHDGYPGHYGHGRVGVYAAKLDQASIWQALKNRRTIATTGANIQADFRLGNAFIGEETPRLAGMKLKLKVEGTAPIERVDLIEASAQRWRVRRLPMGGLSPEYVPGRHKIKIECGWGHTNQRSDWLIKASLVNARLLGVTPCFRHSIYPMSEEESSDRILSQSSRETTWQCRAMANPVGFMGGTHFNASGTQAVILEVEAGTGSRLKVTAGDIHFDISIARLLEGSVGKPVGGFLSPALKIHRAVPEREFSCHYQEKYLPLGKAAGFVYARVTQSDGQVAWISPIWFGEG